MLKNHQIWAWNILNFSAKIFCILWKFLNNFETTVHTIILPWIDRGIRLPSLLRFVLCMGRMQRGQTLLTLPTTMFISHAFDTSRVTFKGLAFWPNWSLFSHMYAYFMRSLTTNQMRLPSLTWIFGTRRNVTSQVFFTPFYRDQIKAIFCNICSWIK